MGVHLNALAPSVHLLMKVTNLSIRLLDGIAIEDFAEVPGTFLCNSPSAQNAKCVVPQGQEVSRNFLAKSLDSTANNQSAHPADIKCLVNVFR